MRILVTNDDGINAPGLAVLQDIARQLSTDVWTIAPEIDQSGNTTGMTAIRWHTTAAHGPPLLEKLLAAQRKKPPPPPAGVAAGSGGLTSATGDAEDRNGGGRAGRLGFRASEPTRSRSPPQPPRRRRSGSAWRAADGPI